MKTKTFKKVYACALIFIGIVVLGLIFSNMYGVPIYDKKLNALKTETLFIPTGRHHGLVDCLELMVFPIFVYVMFVAAAGFGVFWFEEKTIGKKRRHG